MIQRREQCEINGRTIYIVTGNISQTVNICTPENIRGQYDWIVRLLRQDFVNCADLKKQPDLSSIIDWLKQDRKGQVEKPVELDTDLLSAIDDLTPETSPNDASEDLWVKRAMQITEMCINELVQEFLDLPYLHRVEHSIHTRLYSILRTQPHFDRHFFLNEGDMQTQPIHKEWPETIPRLEKDNRRGNFDLAILSPGTIKKCTLRNFSTGKIVPPIVIEMGLNYGEGHLAADAEKLLNSKVQHGYLVHLLREMPHNSAIDATIEQLKNENNVKVAFARYYKGSKFIKLLDDTKIRPG